MNDTLASGELITYTNELDNLDPLVEHYDGPNWNLLASWFIFGLGIMMLFLKRTVTELYSISTREKMWTALPVISLMCLRAWS